MKISEARLIEFTNDLTENVLCLLCLFVATAFFVLLVAKSD
jgi:hypothetical protein